MKRHSVVLASLILTLLATPVFAGGPFGWFDGSVSGGNAGAGVMSFTGWALDDDGIFAVRFEVDGSSAGQAFYGMHRPVVESLYPGFPDSATAGFGFQLNTAHYLNGRHRVTVKAITNSGEEIVLGSKIYEFLNTTHNLIPFGAIEDPLENAELFGTCDIDDLDRRLTVVTGYALDPGMEVGDMGIGYVELLLDGAILYNSRTSCFYAEETGGLTNCYGLRRPDVQGTFPTLKDAPHAGFRFVLDIGALLYFGRVPGHHTLTIRAGDIAGQVANIDEIPVFFFCDEFLANEGAFGWVNPPNPPGPQIFGSLLSIYGWALDREGVASVHLTANGITQLGFAATGFAHPGVNEVYPGFPDSMTAGWAAEIDTSLLADGENLIQVIVTDFSGQKTMIGERKIVILNP